MCRDKCNKCNECNPCDNGCQKVECGCKFEVDAACVRYTKNNLSCTGHPKGALLEDILESIDKKLCEEGEQGVTGCCEIEESDWKGLLEKALNEDLEVGRYYKITDFLTIYDQPDYSAPNTPKTSVATKAGTVDPIILLAISQTDFAKEVWRPSTPRHTLEYDIKYTQTGMGNYVRGRITYCKDEFNNETNYDHTVVLLKRYESVSGSGVYDSYWDTGFGSTEVLTFGNGCVGNKIEGNYYKLGGGFEISNNVFGDGSTSNVLKIESNNNTFGNSTINNTFGNSTINNTFGDQLQGNTFGNQFKDNIFGSGVQNNSFSNNISTISFTSATHVYNTYTCNIFKRQDGTVRLSYYDNNDTLVVVSSTS